MPIYITSSTNRAGTKAEVVNWPPRAARKSKFASWATAYCPHKPTKAFYSDPATLICNAVFLSFAFAEPIVPLTPTRIIREDAAALGAVARFSHLRSILRVAAGPPPFPATLHHVLLSCAGRGVRRCDKLRKHRRCGLSQQF